MRTPPPSQPASHGLTLGVAGLWLQVPCVGMIDEIGKHWGAIATKMTAEPTKEHLPRQVGRQADSKRADMFL